MEEKGAVQKHKKYVSYVALLLFGVSAVSVFAEDAKIAEREIRTKFDSRYPAPKVCESPAKDSPEHLACESVRLKIQNLDQKIAPKAWKQEYAWKWISPHPFPKNGCDAANEDALDCARKILKQDFQNTMSDLFFGEDCAKYNFAEIKPLAAAVTNACQQEKTFQNYYSCIANTGLKELAKKSSPVKSYYADYVKQKLFALRQLAWELDVLKQYCEKKQAAESYSDCGEKYLAQAFNIKSAQDIEKNKTLFTAKAIGLNRASIAAFSENKWLCRPQPPRAKRAEKDCTDCDERRAVPAPLDQNQVSDMAKVVDAAKDQEMITIQVNTDEPFEEEKPTNNKEPSSKISAVLDEAFEARQNDAKLTEKQKKDLKKLSENKKYRQNLENHYQKVAENLKGDEKKKLEEIRKNFNQALNQTLDPKKEKPDLASNNDFDFSFEEETLINTQISENKTESQSTESKPSDSKNATADKKEEQAKKIAEAKEQKSLLEKVKKDFTYKIDPVPPKPKKEKTKPLQFAREPTKDSAAQKEYNAFFQKQTQFAASELAQGRYTLSPEMADMGKTLLLSEVEDLKLSEDEKKRMRAKVEKQWKETVTKYKAYYKSLQNLPFEERFSSLAQKINRDFTHKWIDWNDPVKGNPDAIFALQCLNQEHCSCVGNIKVSIAYTLAVIADEPMPKHKTLLVQYMGYHVAAVIYDSKEKTVWDLVGGGAPTADLKGNFFHPSIVLNAELKRKDGGAIDHEKLRVFSGRLQMTKEEEAQIAALEKKESISRPPQLDGLPRNVLLKDPTGGARGKTDSQYSLPYFARETNTATGTTAAATTGENPTVNWDKAQSDMHAALSSKAYKDYLKILQNPTLLKESAYSKDQVAEMLEATDKIYGILAGVHYVSGQNQDRGKAALSKHLAEENPELAALYDLLKKTRDPLAKQGDEGDAEKAIYFDLFKVLGPENWLLYKDLNSIRPNETVLASSLDKEGLSFTTPSNLDSYFHEPISVSFIANYKSGTDTQNGSGFTKNIAKPSHVDATVAVSDEDLSPDGTPSATAQKATSGEKSAKNLAKTDNREKSQKGQGKDANGIPYKPEPEGYTKLKPIEFAQFIQQGVESDLAQLFRQGVKSGKSGIAMRFTPALSAALRSQKEYKKSFVEWFTDSGYRAISDQRGATSLQISGPDNNSIPKDVAALLADFLKGKDKTGAQNLALHKQITKNYGSVDKYLEQVKKDFEESKPKPYATPRPKPYDDNFDLFEKLAKAQGIDPNVMARAEKKSFQYKKRGPENFTMGSPKSEIGRQGDEEQHTVSLTYSYDIQLTPVTQLQWYLVMGKNPSSFRVAADEDDDYETLGDTHLRINHPVESVSWEDTQDFINKLNKADGKCTYRLPTEAQWESAARAVTKTPYSLNRTNASLDQYAWYDKNSGDRTHAVAKKLPNPDGLYDMHGNVWQWVDDTYCNYKDISTIDPVCYTGLNRVARGGSWNSNALSLRSAERNDFPPEYNFAGLGLRLLRLCPDTESTTKPETK